MRIILSSLNKPHIFFPNSPHKLVQISNLHKKTTLRCVITSKFLQKFFMLSKGVLIFHYVPTRTRMYSSRIRTVRCSSRLLGRSGVSAGGVCPGGVCLGVSFWGGLCLGCLPGKVSAWGCLPRGCLPGGCLTRGCLPREVAA